MFAMILVGLFVAVMIAVGIWGMKKTTNVQDFFLGGRTIGPVMSAIAYGTTYFSAVIFIGFAGKVGWGYGPGVMWIAAGNALIGSFLAWWVLAKRTRTMSHNLGAMTMPEFFHERYADRNLKIAAALIIFVFLVPYSASVFKGLGHLFQANFNVSYELALLVMIAITGVYLVLGGYFAVAMTDFIQGLVMLVGCFAIVGFLTWKGGGPLELWTTIVASHQAHVPPAAAPSPLGLVALVFMTSFGPWGMPQMVQKFYAIKNVAVIKTAMIVTTLFAAVVTFTAYLNGAAAHVFFSAPPLTNGKPDFDRIVPDLMKTILPEGLMALILLLILSASMSTLSSLVLVSASSIANDLYKGRINPNVSQKKALLVMRIVSGLFVALSCLMALYPFDVIVTLMSISWGAIAGSFMAPFLYSLFWKRTSRLGIWVGMGAGLGTAVVLFFVLGPAQSTISACIAMIVPFAVVPAVSLATKAPESALLNKAFADLKK